MGRNTESETFRTDASMYPVYCTRNAGQDGRIIFRAGELYGVTAEAQDYRNIIGEDGEGHHIENGKTFNEYFSSPRQVYFLTGQDDPARLDFSRGTLPHMVYGVNFHKLVLSARPLTLSEYEDLQENWNDTLRDSNCSYWLETTSHDPDKETADENDKAYIADPDTGLATLESPSEPHKVRPCLFLTNEWASICSLDYPVGLIVDIKGVPYVYVGQNSDYNHVLIANDVLRNEDGTPVLLPFNNDGPVVSYSESSLKKYIDGYMKDLAPIKPETVYCVQKCEGDENWCESFVSLDNAIAYADEYIKNRLGTENELDTEAVKAELNDKASVIGETDPYESMGEHPMYSKVYDAWIDLKEGVALGVISVPLAEKYFNEPYDIGSLRDYSTDAPEEER